MSYKNFGHARVFCSVSASVCLDWDSLFFFLSTVFMVLIGMWDLLAISGKVRFFPENLHCSAGECRKKENKFFFLKPHVSFHYKFGHPKILSLFTF